MSTADLNPTKRFSSRVADYVKYRPDYPRRILAVLREQVGLSPDWTVADIACGTGISSRMFLENGNEVIGVEPNDDMRAAAESELRGLPRFRAVKGTAEATSLPDGCADLVIAAQAFHWFDRRAAAVEFRRISRRASGAPIAIMWNQRITDGSPFAKEYDLLLERSCPEYKQVSQRWVISDSDLHDAFGVRFQKTTVPNEQVFDLAGLNGRAASSSYVPQRGHASHAEFFAELKKLFERHERGGVIKFEYETELYVAALS